MICTPTPCISLSRSLRSSPLAFREYLKSITKKVPLGELDLRLRDKEKHGVGVHITYNTPKGRACQTYVSNPYYFGFFTKVYHRRPCYRCAYRYEDRVTDLTFGDYWGVENHHREFDCRAGVSALLVNTEKGDALLEAVGDGLQLSETTKERIAAKNNLTLGDARREFRVPGFRKAFFDTLRAKGWKAAERKYLFNKARFRLWLKELLPSGLVARIKKRIKGR